MQSRCLGNLHWQFLVHGAVNDSFCDTVILLVIRSCQWLSCCIDPTDLHSSMASWVWSAWLIPTCVSWSKILSVWFARVHPKLGTPNKSDDIMTIIPPVGNFSMLSFDHGTCVVTGLAQVSDPSWQPLDFEEVNYWPHPIQVTVLLLT